MKTFFTALFYKRVINICLGATDCNVSKNNYRLCQKYDLLCEILSLLFCCQINQSQANCIFFLVTNLRHLKHCLLPEFVAVAWLEH